MSRNCAPCSPVSAGKYPDGDFRFFGSEPLSTSCSMRFGSTPIFFAKTSAIPSEHSVARPGSRSRRSWSLLGIAANTAAFTMVDHVLIQPLPFPDEDRLESV